MVQKLSYELREFKEYLICINLPVTVKKVIKLLFKKCERSLKFIESFKKNLVTRSMLLEYNIYDVLDIDQIRNGNFVKKIEKVNIN